MYTQIHRLQKANYNALRYNAVRAILALMKDDIEQLMQSWCQSISLWQKIMRPILANNAVTPADKRILYGLFQTGPITKNELAATVILEGSSLTRSLKRLAKVGLLTCRSCDDDKRCVLLNLTPAGTKKVKKIMQEAHAVFKTALQANSADARAALKVIRQLNDNWTNIINEQ